MPSKIEWTNETWNPVVGCTKCSPGCKNCYAEKMAYRLRSMGVKGYADDKGKPNGVVSPFGLWRDEVRCLEHKLDKPRRWRKPRKIFVCSMSDLFHPKVPTLFQAKVHDIISSCPQHTFQILTKRPKIMYEHFIQHPHPDNAWLGVSVSTQKEADEKIPILLHIPAAVRFVSIEPMLEGIDIRKYLVSGADGLPEEIEKYHNWLDWVIVGGESGSKARPMHPTWARSIRDQCQAAGVPFFFKQWGEWMPVEPMMDNFPTCGDTSGLSHTARTHDWDDYRYSIKVGKKNAGSLLDEMEWKEYPK